MTREKFIEVLHKHGYFFNIGDNPRVLFQDNKIIIKELYTSGFYHKLKSLPPDVVFDNEGSLYLHNVTSIPEGVEFNNKGSVYLTSLKSINTNIKFNNTGSVDLDSLETLNNKVVFNNGMGVDLRSLKSIPPGVEFRVRLEIKKRGIINLKSLIGGRFNEWPDNIEGIDSTRLLNLMIKRGMFI